MATRPVPSQPVIEKLMDYTEQSASRSVSKKANVGGGQWRRQPAIVSKAGKFNLWWSKDLPHYTLPEALTATG
jgi:hypothetical protein